MQPDHIPDAGTEDPSPGEAEATFPAAANAAVTAAVPKRLQGKYAGFRANSGKKYQDKCDAWLKRYTGDVEYHIAALNRFVDYLETSYGVVRFDDIEDVAAIAKGYFPLIRSGKSTDTAKKHISSLHSFIKHVFDVELPGGRPGYTAEARAAKAKKVARGPKARSPAELAERKRLLDLFWEGVEKHRGRVNQFHAAKRYALETYIIQHKGKDRHLAPKLEAALVEAELQDQRGYPLLDLAQKEVFVAPASKPATNSAAGKPHKNNKHAAATITNRAAKSNANGKKPASDAVTHFVNRYQAAISDVNVPEAAAIRTAFTGTKQMLGWNSERLRGTLVDEGIVDRASGKLTPKGFELARLQAA